MIPWGRVQRANTRMTEIHVDREKAKNNESQKGVEGNRMIIGTRDMSPGLLNNVWYSEKMEKGFQIFIPPSKLAIQ